jgi:hypothetical protein
MKEEQLIITSNNLIEDDNIKKLLSIIKSNKVNDKQNIIIAQINTTNNTINNYNVDKLHVDKFHIDIFLNNKCKDAINISDFMKTINPTYLDIKDCYQDGLVRTITNTVVSRLKDIDLEKRPIHCSDKKRKTLYIKDNNNWNKDIHHELIRKIIDEISYKQVHALKQWFLTTNEQMSSEEYTNKLMEITKSLTDDLSLNRSYSKIIGNISETVII